jgi:hypothetical protein
MVRAAINMGYHREPSQSPGISVLRAEYRRRTWLSVVSLDNMASFLGGFPRMISSIYSDTAEPHNLHDRELSEDTVVLPPSRPLMELTPVTYLIAKGRLLSALGRVADFNSALQLDSYETVLEIDRALDDAHEKLPPHMKVASPKGVSELTPTMPHYSKLSLLGMYYHGMCTLHRRFLAKARADSRFKVSQDRCVSSALGILSFQPCLEPSFYQLSQPRQMLTLGALILLLELELRRQAPDTEASPDSGVLLQALEKSCALWAEVINTCDEAGRVHQFLARMLSGFEAGTSTAAAPSQSPSPEMPLDLARFNEQVDAANGVFSFERDLTNMDFDWVLISLPH